MKKQHEHNSGGTQPKRLSRREFVGTSAKAAAAGAAITAFPAIVRADDPIRSIGLGVSIINEIQGQASQDLGFQVKGQALGYGAMFGKMLNQNDQYEIAEGYYNDMDVMWPAGVWQPIDTHRIKDWDKVTNLSKTGRLTPESNEGQGDAPFRHLWVDENGMRTMEQSRYITMVPGWHNADSIGYNPEDTGRPIESWADLMAEEFSGRVALLNVPQIGTMDASLAIEAMGLFEFKDKGNMTREEIDFLIDFLIEKKKAGHFRAFWETFGQSVNAHGERRSRSGEHVVARGHRDQGRRRIPCVYAFPKEGMRGWHGGLSISAQGHRQGARPGLRVHRLVARGLARGLRGPAGLLHVGARERQATSRARRVGFLVRGQARREGASRPLRHHHRGAGRGARRRVVLEPLQQHRGVELAHGRERLPGEALDGVPRRLIHRVHAGTLPCGVPALTPASAFARVRQESRANTPATSAS